MPSLETAEPALTRSDHENCAAREWHSGGVLLVGVDHAQLDGQFPGLVGDDGIVDCRNLAEDLDVLDPAQMRFDAVT